MRQTGDLGPELNSYPEEDDELWAFTQKHIILNKHHPKYIVKLLKSCRADLPHSEVVSKATITTSMDMILQGLTHEDVLLEHPALSDIYAIVTTALKVAKLNHRKGEIAELLKNRMELGSSIGRGFV